MKVSSSAFFVIVALFATPVFAQKTPCETVDSDNARFFEILKNEKRYAIVHSKTEKKVLEFVGVGLQFGPRFDVERVIPYSPAEKAGVPLWGKIVAVDGVPTSELSPYEVGRAIRGEGKVGTFVHLAIELPVGAKGSIGFSLERTDIRYEKDVQVLCVVENPTPNK